MTTRGSDTASKRFDLSEVVYQPRSETHTRFQIKILDRSGIHKILVEKCKQHDVRNLSDWLLRF
jgi:hypothetical protein